MTAMASDGPTYHAVFEASSTAATSDLDVITWAEE